MADARTAHSGARDASRAEHLMRQAPSVDIRQAESSDEVRAIEELLAAIWAAPKGRPPVSAHVLTAFVHTGNYVASAWWDGEPVGASVGFFGYKGQQRVLHSHITGVTPRLQGAGVGFALKQHQRAWALERAIDQITWTFDPLLRGNAWFNLMKLGGEIAAYHPNLYGAMSDGINASDESDRCLVRWRLDGGRSSGHVSVADGVEPSTDSSSVVALSENSGGRPAADDDPGALAAARKVLCWIPDNVVSMRVVDPELARAWRLALRSSMGAAIQSGLVATGITKDGWYVLEREPAGDGARSGETR